MTPSMGKISELKQQGGLVLIDLKNIKNIAIIGATTNKEKYGYKVLKNLKDKGYTLYPINPKYNKIEGIETYASVKDLPKEGIDLIVFVVPAKIGITAVKEAYEEGFRRFWFQPGAESDEIEEYLEKLPNVEYSFIKCIMVETSKN
ncbi:CoA-binding domain protein [Petrotoga mobilis SJ95]|uniref:CoA-binding domain protein n=1 Tax=Petrotoga mobilis (strain DSM 10674 / SJ95) TaxID=403833 RepID=A9BJG8_PETMO|nr:CoA-binding domain protein [Petrotoga mobilis SJ95]